MKVELVTTLITPRPADLRSASSPGPSGPPDPVPARDPVPSPAVVKANRRRKVREGLLFFALILPNLAAILIFSYYPAAYNVVLSFMDWDFLSPSPAWVGLDNYIRLFQDPGFYRVMGNTLLFTAVAVFGALVGGLLIGTLLSTKIRFTGFARTMAFAPHMLPGAAIGILWLFMFDPTYGLSRWFFDLFGLSSPAWTTTSDWSLWAVTIAYAWQRLGFVAIIYYTAILDIPKDVLEAAQLDGAGAWTLMRRIIVPLLGPVTLFLVITGIISAAQAFDIIASMTSGGPGISSSTLTWMIYEEGFQNFDIGRAASLGTVLFVILMIITAVQVRLFDKRIHYS